MVKVCRGRDDQRVGLLVPGQVSSVFVREFWFGLIAVGHSRLCLLRGCYFWFCLLVGDQIDVFFVGEDVHVLSLIEVREPIFSGIGFDLKRREYHIFVPYGFAVDPGVAVVELELVQTFLHGVYAVFHLPCPLLVAKEESPRSFIALDLSQVIQSHSHVHVLHHDSIVEDRELDKNLEVSAG